MRNILSTSVKGYPVYGWLVLLLIAAFIVLMIWTGQIPNRCGGVGNC